MSYELLTASADTEISVVLYRSLRARRLYLPCIRPSKHKTLNQCCAGDGLPSTTLAQHQPNIGSMSYICWGVAHTTLWLLGVDTKTT